MIFLLKEWKIEITSVRQGYKSIESWYDYKMETGTMFGGWGAPMNIGKAQDSFDENETRYLTQCIWTSGKRI